ncbi:MAG: hypothetical protein H0U74_07760 [Bradymonadaceae bacterium]|nr:hypothetical protein [Lujinxingiaceae bacterium]
MAHASHHHDIAPPKDLKIPKLFFMIALGLLIFGAVVFAAALFIAPVRAWQGYLIGFWFTLSLGLAGPFLIATQYLSKAGWGISIRRIPEAMGAYLFAAIPLSIAALLGAPKLFKWLKPEAVNDAIIAQKFDFLNFTGLALVSIAAPIAFALVHFLMRRNSLAQDVDGKASHSRQNILLSALFVIVFVLGFSFMTWYWIMSLDAHWFSTMFQVYAFAGMFQSGLALVAIVLLVLLAHGYFGGTVGVQHVHDIGKLVFAFTVFYAYIAFCQFMLIWYANIPEEVVWYTHRLEDGWQWVTLALPFVKFIIPFLVLLPMDHKKNKNNILWYICWLLLAVQLFEVWYWVTPYPHFDGHHGPSLPIYELPIALGFVGLFMLVTGRALQAHKLVPIKDPLLHESIPHSHSHHGSSQADLEAQANNVVRES